MSDMHVDLARQWAAEQRDHLAKIESQLSELDRDLADTSTAVIENRTLAALVFFIVAAAASTLVAGVIWLMDVRADTWMFIGGVTAGTITGTVFLTGLNADHVRDLNRIREQQIKLQHRRERARGALDAFERFTAE